MLTLGDSEAGPNLHQFDREASLHDEEISNRLTLTSKEASATNAGHPDPFDM